MKTSVFRAGIVALFVVCSCAFGVTKKIWTVGDSNTQGWTSDPARGTAGLYDNYRQRLATELRNNGSGIDAVFVGTQVDGYGLRHDGHSGRTVPFISANLTTWLTQIGAANAPDIIIIMAGTNDCRYATKFSETQLVACRVVSMLKIINDWYKIYAPLKLSTYKVYIGNVPPYRKGWDGQLPPLPLPNPLTDANRPPYLNFTIEENIRQKYQAEIDWRIGAGDDSYAKYNLAAVVDIAGVLGKQLAQGNGSIWAAPCPQYDQNRKLIVKGDNLDKVHFSQAGYDVMAVQGFAPAIKAGVNKTNYKTSIATRYTWTEAVAPNNPCP